MHHRDLNRLYSGKACSTSVPASPLGRIRVSTWATAHENGSSTNSIMGPDALREEIHGLQALMLQQQKAIEAQQRAIEQFHAAPSHPHPLAAGWSNRNSSISMRENKASPFESQRIGIGDRRLLGLFDSRFHSTSRSVGSGWHGGHATID